MDLLSPVTQIGLSAAVPDLLDILSAIQEAVTCKDLETNLWGDRGREVINIGRKE